MPDVRELSDQALELAGSGQYEKAPELVHTAIKLDANNPNLWYHPGIILSKMGRYLDARNSFAQAADIDPGFAEAWYNK
ncbi:MAG: tetratricopeptide repeat protein [Methanoregula sp.]|nr:tetratricopeptide repeat protein [Methanoregula sp.]